MSLSHLEKFIYDHCIPDKLKNFIPNSYIKYEANYIFQLLSRANNRDEFDNRIESFLSDFRLVYDKDNKWGEYFIKKYQADNGKLPNKDRGEMIEEGFDDLKNSKCDIRYTGYLIDNYDYIDDYNENEENDDKYSNKYIKQIEIEFESTFKELQLLIPEIKNIEDIDEVKNKLNCYTLVYITVNYDKENKEKMPDKYYITYYINDIEHSTSFDSIPDKWSGLYKIFPMYPDIPEAPLAPKPW